MMRTAGCCRVCRFSRIDPDFPEDSSYALYECRRHAPHPEQNGEDTRTAWSWPLVMPTEWCGEFKPK